MSNAGHPWWRLVGQTVSLTVEQVAAAPLGTRATLLDDNGADKFTVVRDEQPGFYPWSVVNPVADSSGERPVACTDRHLTIRPVRVEDPADGWPRSVPISAPLGERGRRMVEDPEAYAREARERAKAAGWIAVSASWRQNLGVQGDDWRRNSEPHFGIETPEMLDRHPHARIWRWRDPRWRRRLLKPARVTR